MMKILVVGISVRAMVESAVRSGYSVIGLDAFGDRDLRAFTEAYSLRRDFHDAYSARALYKASRKLDFDAVAYTSNLENHPEVVACFSSGHKLIGNPPEVIASVRDWHTLFARLRNSGFPVPMTLPAGQTRKADSTYRWLVKPVLSGGGHGIAFLNEDKIPDDQCMIQEYIPGKPCSASFVANGRKCVVLGISKQLLGMPQLGSHGFRYCGNILPLQETGIILDQVRRIAAFLTLEYGLVGMNGLDFILNGDQIYLTEVNPRYSASMELIEQAYGLPIFHLHVRSVLEGKLPEFKLETTLKDGKYFGKAILFAEKDVNVPDTRGWRSRNFRDIPDSGEKLCKGDPICTILVARPSPDETTAGLLRQAAVLKKEIYDRT